jgi:hypothetical protein
LFIHPTLFEFAGHYRYEPRPVAPARGNEKGRVERAIRYVRDSFAAREFVDLDDLNAQADAWCHGLAADRRCPEQNTLSVREAFAMRNRKLAHCVGDFDAVDFAEAGPCGTVGLMAAADSE